jgi:type II secretory pathway component PulF
MKIFLYKAKDGPDKHIEGKISASSVEDAVARLSQKGYVALYVKELALSEKDKKQSRQLFVGVKNKELITFTVQLARLLKSGVTMLKAIYILAEQARSVYFRTLLEDIAEMVSRGNTLSMSLDKYPKVFSHFYVSMVRAGEKSGTVNESLNRIAEYYVKQQKIIKKVRSAMAYPVFILIVGLLTLFFVFTNVLPKILPVVMGLNVAIPMPTRILLGASSFMKANWFWIALASVIFILIAKRASASKTFRVSFSSFKQKIPVFGDIIYKSELARFARSLEVSIRGGVEIIDSINMALTTLNEHSIRDNIKSNLIHLESGESVSSVFEKSGVFSPMVLATITVAEETGNLPEALSEVAEAYESECEESIDILVSMVEPVMILLVGLLVGFIVSAVLLPVFQVGDIQL